MEGFLIGLLMVILVLWLIKEILAVAGLPDPAGRVVWVVALVLAVLWLIKGFI